MTNTTRELSRQLRHQFGEHGKKTGPEKVSSTWNQGGNVAAPNVLGSFVSPFAGHVYNSSS